MKASMFKVSVTLAASMFALTCFSAQAFASTTNWQNDPSHSNSNPQIDSFGDGTTTWVMTSHADLSIWGIKSAAGFTIDHEDLSILISGGSSSPFMPSWDPWTSTVDYHSAADGSIQYQSDPTTPGVYAYSPQDLSYGNVDSPGVLTGPTPAYAIGNTGYYAPGCYPPSTVNLVEVNLQ